MMNKVMRKLSKGTAIVMAAACMMSAVPVQAMASEEIEMYAADNFGEAVMEDDMEDGMEESMEECDAMAEDAVVDEAEEAGEAAVDTEEEAAEEECGMVSDEAADAEDEEALDQEADSLEAVDEASDDLMDDLICDENAEADNKLAALTEGDMSRREEINELIEGLQYDPASQIATGGSAPEFVRKEGRQDDKDHYVVLTREKKSLDRNMIEVGTVEANMSDVYPGALLIGNNHLAEGCPDVLPVVDRAPLTLDIDINGAGDECVVEVENPTPGNVRAAISNALGKWAEKGNTTTAKIEYNLAEVHSESQLSAELGVNVKNLDLKINFKDVYEQKKQCAVLKCKQVYYSVNTSVPGNPADLFGEKTTAADLKKKISNDRPPVEVTNVSYGRTIYVVFTTTSKSNEFMQSLNAVVDNTEISEKASYKEIYENTTVSGCILGGTAAGGAQALAGGSGVQAIKRAQELITTQADFKDFTKSAAAPIAYKTNYVKDGQRACVNMSSEYVETKAEVFSGTHVYLDTATWYALKSVYVKAKPILGYNADGSMILGAAEAFLNTTDVSCDKQVDIPAGYADFEFGYDIRWGSDWPYRGVFYKDLCKDINISLGGTCRYSSCKIKVDGKMVVSI